MVSYYRRIIRVTAEDSPNVILARRQIALGIVPTGEEVVPGVLSWDELQHRLATWDPERQCIGLMAQFYEGPESKLFPPTWLDLAARAELRDRCLKSPAEAVGIDPAEGGDKTSMAAVNRYGLKALVSRKTPNTAVIPREAMAFAREHGVLADNVMFDRGGGGKQHADAMREAGWPVRTVAFGEPLKLEPRRGIVTLETKKEGIEERYVYFNRRAEMYGDLSIAIDPSSQGFWIGPEIGKLLYDELRMQLEAIPKTYDRDGEGRLKLLPKNNPLDPNADTLVKRIGHSPDESDSVVIAYFAMTHKKPKNKAGLI